MNYNFFVRKNANLYGELYELTYTAKYFFIIVIYPNTCIQVYPNTCSRFGKIRQTKFERIYATVDSIPLDTYKSLR